MPTFRHPLGYRFDYPDGWQVQQTEQAIVILPGDAARDAAGQPLEVLILASQTAPGIERADDPRVLAFFDQNSPGLRRQGAAAPAPSGFGPGARLTFEGQINGIDARRDVYVAVHGTEVIYLCHEARRDLTDGRRADAERIFAGLGHEQPQGDAQLAGEWRRSATSGSNSYSGSVWATDDEVVRLYPDGTLEYGTATTVSGGTEGVSILGGGRQHVQRGRYVAAGGQLVVTWLEGGTEAFQYSVFMHEGSPHLKIQSPGQSARFYRRVG